ncbi:VWA domain-containing protein [Streptomyces sp. NPDC091385]|uniref:VWA domain-containing protein n=1 Tax=Streptomyces sp. NPDC091385 TaxID=3365997 RepID=UPI0037F1C733
MGILTLLRNAFGRRKERPTDPENAPTVPEPREHELVSAAFDDVTVPRQQAAESGGSETRGTATAEPEKAEAAVTAEPDEAGVAETVVTAEPEKAAPAEAAVTADPGDAEAAVTAEPDKAEAADTTVTAEPEKAESAESTVTAEPDEAEVAGTAAVAEPEKAETAQAAATAEPDEAEVAETAVTAEAAVTTAPDEAQTAEAAVTAEPDEAEVAETPVAAEPSQPEVTEASLAPVESSEAEVTEHEGAEQRGETGEPEDVEATVTAEIEPPEPEATAGLDEPEVPEQRAEPEATEVAEPQAEAEATEPETTEATAQVPAQRTEIEASELDITVVSETADAEAQPENEPLAEATPPGPTAPVTPSAEATPAPEPETDTQPEPTQNAQPEPAEATTAPEATTDPAPADGETAPQGPPAPDNESRTGGAGGNRTAAEGEAEADRAQPPAPAEGEPREAEADQPQPTPANDTPAATALAKADLTKTPAKTYLVLDRSASMRPYYKDGSAQALADQTLALATELDKSAPAVHVVFFSTEVDGTTDLTPGTTDTVDDMHATLGRMGRTSYHAAVEAVLAHYDQHHTPADKALVIFQTDGAPDAKTPATQALTNAAKTHPNVFFSFVAFGEHDNKAFDYLRKLKTPNTSFFHAGPTPRELTDTELYEGVLAGWRP